MLSYSTCLPANRLTADTKEWAEPQVGTVGCHRRARRRAVYNRVTQTRWGLTFMATCAGRKVAELHHAVFMHDGSFLIHQSVCTEAHGDGANNPEAAPYDGLMKRAIKPTGRTWTVGG